MHVPVSRKRRKHLQVYKLKGMRMPEYSRIYWLAFR
jgi:hypothetical protein